MMKLLKPIKRKILRGGKLIFGGNKGILFEYYFDLSRYTFPKEAPVNLYFEYFKLNIQNELKVTLIYLDTSKKINPVGTLEFQCISEHRLNKYDIQEMDRNDFRLEIFPKIEEKELWKIRFELNKYDDVQFCTAWG